MIGLLDQPTNGKIFIDGTNTTTLDDDKISSFRNKKLGFIFQFSNLLTDLSVLENVLLPREIGVMRAIGAKRKDILIIFIFQGIIIGAIGACVGTATGLGYTVYADVTKMEFNNSLPLEVTYNWEKIIQTAVTSFALAIIASLYPSYRATKQLPVEAMRTV